MVHNFKAVIFILGFCLFYVSTDSVLINIFERIKRDVSDDCRPRPGPHGDEPPPSCCSSLPSFISGMENGFDSCHQILKTSFENNKNKIHRRFANAESFSVTDEHPHHPHHPHRRNPEFRLCMMECVFNNSGYLTPDGMLNEDILNQRVNEAVLKDSRWAPVGQTIFKKCIATAKEANTQYSKEGCKPAAQEYAKCMAREAFFNCPSEIWTNSTECGELKSKLERCPNLPPPPPNFSIRPKMQQPRP